MLLLRNSSARVRHGSPVSGNASPPPALRVRRRFAAPEAPADISDDGANAGREAGAADWGTAVKYAAALGFLALAVTGAAFLRNPAPPANTAPMPTPPPAPAPAPLEQVDSRLDQLSDRMKQISSRLESLSAPAPEYPTASAIAAELKRQTAAEPAAVPQPTLTFEHKASSIANGRLQFTILVLTRRGNPASDFAVKAPPGISAWLEALPSTPEFERYQLAFQPQSGDLPNEWTFSISYADKENKPRERTYQAVFDPKQPPPAHLQISEKRG